MSFKSKHILFPLGVVLLAHMAEAAPKQPKVDSLDPLNRSYLENFCRYHPGSGLCFFTPNPPVRPTPTDPEMPPAGPPVPIGGGGPAITLCYAAPSKVITVAGTSQLQPALDKATPGTLISLLGGTYGGTYTYNKNANAGAPIVIAPATAGTVTITGMFNFGGSYGVIKGLKFTGSGFKITLTGRYNRVSRNQFTNTNADGAIRLDGGHAYDRIDHNEFRSIVGAAVRGNINSSIPHQGHHIDHNYFFNHTVRGDNESVMLMLTDAFHDSFLTYEYNLFDDVVNGPSNQSEVVSTKTAATTFRGNTFLRSKVDVTFRETNRSLAEGNCFKDGAGIKVFGDDNVVRGNYVTGGGKIEIRGGDGTMDMTHAGCPKSGQTALLPDSCNTAHTAARRSIVENNTGPIIVGGHYDGDNIPAQNTVLRNNSGPISFVNHTGTTKTDGTPTNNVQCLTPANVGINVPDLDCSGN